MSTASGREGFGGTCLPKDLNALAWTANDCEATCNVIEAAWETNVELRPTIFEELGIPCP